MKSFSRRIALVATAILALAAIAVWRVTRLNPAQQTLARTLELVDGIVDPATGGGKTFSATLEVLRSKGLPDKLDHARLDLRYAAPDKLRLSTTVGGEVIDVGRKGDELWSWQPSKKFALQAVPGVPLFSTDAKRLDDSKIGPLAIHIDATQLKLAPTLFKMHTLEDETVDTLRCRVLSITPLQAAKDWLHLPDATITLWLRDDGYPVQLGYRGADGKSDVLLALHDVKVGETIPVQTWDLPAPAGVKVEPVALRHILRFLAGVPQLIDKPKPNVLGPAKGEKHVVSTAGTGRLEMHDGTRVLFLKGTPDEMGAQHGELLRREVREVVSRILYGIGVGSSFAKGEWFLGTIERCQDRIQPFVDPRHTREMDALASAAGVEREESRLANFFPELFHCSGFALTGASTKDGHMYHGRILDYMKGVGLEPNAVVMVMQPDQGNAWVNISYAGFIGSVTAMNEKHISIGEMGGRGEGNWDGKPMAQLMRDVMEKASTLDEAVAIMRDSKRTCEYYYVIADGRTKQAVGIKATPDIFEVIHPGEAHPQLDTPVKDAVLMSAGDRYKELVSRAQAGWGQFDADSARNLMTHPVCMNSNIHSVLFAPDTLDFWVANADGVNVASHTRYTHYNLAELLAKPAEQTQIKALASP